MVRTDCNHNKNMITRNSSLLFHNVSIDVSLCLTHFIWWLQDFELFKLRLWAGINYQLTAYFPLPTHPPTYVPLLQTLYFSYVCTNLLFMKVIAAKS